MHVFLLALSLDLLHVKRSVPNLLSLLRQELAVLKHTRLAKLVVLEGHVLVAPREVFGPEVWGPGRLPPRAGHDREARCNQLISRDWVDATGPKIVVADADEPRPAEGDGRPPPALRWRVVRHVVLSLLHLRRVRYPLAVRILVDAVVLAFFHASPNLCRCLWFLGRSE